MGALDYNFAVTHTGNFEAFQPEFWIYEMNF